MTLPPLTPQAQSIPPIEVSPAADTARAVAAARASQPPPLPPEAGAALARYAAGSRASGLPALTDNPEWDTAFDMSFRFPRSSDGLLDVFPQNESGNVRILGHGISEKCMVRSVDRVYVDGSRVRVYTAPHERPGSALGVNDTTVPLETWVRYEADLQCGSGTEHQTVYSHWTKVEPTLPAVQNACVPVLLSDLFHPDAACWVGLLSIDSLSHAGRNESFTVLGRPLPVVLSDVRSGPTTTLSVLTRTFVERERLLALFATGRILMLRNPNRRWDPLRGGLEYGYPEDDWYIAVGDVTEERIASDHGIPTRKFSFDVTVVDRPDKLIENVPSRTYRLLRDYATDETTRTTMTYARIKTEYASAGQAFATYQQVYVGTRAPAWLGGMSSVARGAGGGGPYRYETGVYPTRSAARTSWSLRA